jgi:hypothetical protein
MEEHELMRRKLWCDICVAVARAENCHNKNVPTSWADAILATFDERFNPPHKGGE